MIIQTESFRFSNFSVREMQFSKEILLLKSNEKFSSQDFYLMELKRFELWTFQGKQFFNLTLFNFLSTNTRSQRAPRGSKDEKTHRIRAKRLGRMKNFFGHDSLLPNANLFVCLILIMWMRIRENTWDFFPILYFLFYHFIIFLFGLRSRRRKSFSTISSGVFLCLFIWKKRFPFHSCRANIFARRVHFRRSFFFFFLLFCFLFFDLKANVSALLVIRWLVDLFAQFFMTFRFTLSHQIHITVNKIPAPNAAIRRFRFSGQWRFYRFWSFFSTSIET